MHLYWRVIEELKYLNETWTMTDPSLSRCYDRWMRKNAASPKRLHVTCSSWLI